MIAILNYLCFQRLSTKLENISHKIRFTFSINVSVQIQVTVALVNSFPTIDLYFILFLPIIFIYSLFTLVVHFYISDINFLVKACKYDVLNLCV